MKEESKLYFQKRERRIQEPQKLYKLPRGYQNICQAQPKLDPRERQRK